MALQRLNELPSNMQEALAVADSASGLMCPQCNGGDSHERSLSVAKNGIFAVWRCWRDKCGWRGKAVMGPSDYVEGEGERLGAVFRPKAFKSPLWPLSEQELRRLYLKYGITEMTFSRFMVRSTNSGIWMPVMGPNGEDRGGVLRLHASDAKAISFKTADHPWQAWYPDERGDHEPVIIVEDQLSAMRLWQLGFNAVALLGTNLSPDKLEEIADHGAPFGVLALDNDAFDTALGYAREYASTFRLVPSLLMQDIKDSTNEQIIETLEVAGA